MSKHAAHSGLVGRLIGALIMALIIGLVGAATWFVVVRPGGNADAAGQCPTTLRVVTASSFTKVVSAAGRALRGGDDCVQVDTTTTDGRAAAGQVSQTQADVWIPDDTAWTAAVPAKSIAAPGTAGSGTVLATSPIYMVTDPATADRLRAAGGTWLALARLLDTPNSGVRLVVRNPAMSGDGMVAAGAVGEAVWLVQGMDASSLVLANTLKVTRTVNYDLAAVPQTVGEVGLVPEYALLPTLRLAQTNRVYLAGADNTATLRYSWLPSAAAAADPKRSAALRRLLDAFSSPETAKAIASAGLRGPDNIRPTFTGTDALPEVAAKPFDVLGPHHIEHVFATWDPEDRRSNLLIIVDVASGGSTPGPPPGAAGRAQAIDVLRQGCRLLADLMPIGSRLGLWEVGAGATPPNNYRRVVPTERLDDTHRVTFTKAVGSLTVRRGGPGLYDAIVDAYQAVRDDYKTDMFNQVLVLTDDHNKDSTNVKAVESLLNRLTALRDPQRPVKLSVVVLGQKAAADRLKTSLKPVDAYVGNAVGPDGVQAAFIHVVAGGLHD